MAHPELLGHQTKEEIDIDTLPQKQGQFRFMERCEQAFGKLFAFDRRDTDGRVLGYASDDDGQDLCTGQTGESRGTAGRKAKMESRRYVGDAGKVNRLMVLRSSDVHEHLFGLRLGNGVIIGDHGSSEGDGRKTSRQQE